MSLFCSWLRVTLTSEGLDGGLDTGGNRRDLNQARREKPSLDRRQAPCGDIGVHSPGKGAPGRPVAERARQRLGVETPALGHSRSADLRGAFAIGKLIEKIVELGARIAPAKETRALINRTARNSYAQETESARQKPAAADADCPAWAHVITLRK